MFVALDRRRRVQIAPAAQPARRRMRLTEAGLSANQRDELERRLALCYSLSDPELGRFRVSIYLRNGSPELAIRVCSELALAVPQKRTLDFLE